MQTRWTLNLENFGKVKSASITMKPMMLFVGDNNSGKSYVASFLWGILNYGQKIFPQNPPNFLTDQKSVV